MENGNEVSLYLFEAVCARMERTVRRLWIALIIAVVVILITNALWLYAWMSYDYVSSETVYTQDGVGTNIMTGNVMGDENHVQYASELPGAERLD